MSHMTLEYSANLRAEGRIGGLMLFHYTGVEA
jgi:5-carboxymethyl-2-hydroxymuconate isomerase